MSKWKTTTPQVAESTKEPSEAVHSLHTPLTVHPGLHPLFESLSYAAGYAFYRRQRMRNGDQLQDEQRWTVIAAAAMGALIGSRVLGILEQAPRVHITWRLLLMPGGKTIVGGLLGGWLAVEIAKRLLGIASRTGDLFAVPLCLGIAVGRVGCFLAGLADDTYGKSTSLPWGVNFGDGVSRHPTQLYELVFLLLLAMALSRWQAQPHVNGSIFRGFVAAYLTFRLLVDFLKPQPLVYGMNLIQWACLTGLFVLLWGWLKERYQPQVGSMRLVASTKKGNSVNIT